MLEEALVGNDSEGPLCELLFFFLTAIFQAIAEEEEEVAKEQITDADTKGQNSVLLLIDSSFVALELVFLKVILKLTSLLQLPNIAVQVPQFLSHIWTIHYQLFYKNFVLMYPVSDDLKISTLPPQSILRFIPLDFSSDLGVLQMSLTSI